MILGCGQRCVMRHCLVAAVVVFTSMESIASELQDKWLHRLQPPSTVSLVGIPFSDCFKRASIEHQVNLALLLAVAKGESAFDTTAISDANAVGVMQIRWPQTAHHLGVSRYTDLFKPCTNISLGARYLAELEKRFDGRVDLALAAYNYGPTRIEKNRNEIPSGATWYVNYIMTHFDTLTHQQLITTTPATASVIEKERLRRVIIEFEREYRATHFIAAINKALPHASLSVERKSWRQYRVILESDNLAALNQQLSRLSSIGIDI